MRLRLALPALLLVLAASGCGDDDSDSGDPRSERDSPTSQADAILECATDAGLPGTTTRIEGGITAIDLSTDDETILLHVLDSEEDAATYDTGLGMEHEPVDNVVIIGGAIDDDHRATVHTCIEDNPAG